jgi:hypothetical protein
MYLSVIDPVGIINSSQRPLQHRSARDIAVGASFGGLVLNFGLPVCLSRGYRVKRAILRRNLQQQQQHPGLLFSLLSR